MILNNDQVVDIVRALREPTAGRKLSWYSDGGKLWTDLPNRVIVELSRAPDGNFTAAVKSTADDVLGQLDLSAGQVPKEIEALYEAASSAASQNVFAEILDSIRLIDSAGVALRPKIERVSAAQAEQVLKRMAGRWQLDFSRGSEKLLIREDGKCFVDGAEQPKFQLVVLAANDVTGAVEVAKDRPDGRRTQIEYLTIGPDTMTGHAKHDGQKLAYTRIKG